MKMLFPPQKTCRSVQENLKQFFVLEKPKYFKAALKSLCTFYQVKIPTVEWYEYIDYGKTWGKTWSDGAIHLIHPKDWAKKERNIKDWCAVFYHEFWHYLTFVDEEEKADQFAVGVIERGGN